MLSSRLLRNVLSNYAAMAVAGAVSFVLTPILFLRLQPGNYAILVFAFACIAVLDATSIGLAGGQVRFVADLAARELHAELRRLVSSVFYSLVVFGALGAVTLIALSSFLAHYFQLYGSSPTSAPLVLTLVSLSLVFQLPCSGLYGFYMGCQDFHLANAVEITVHLLRAACTVLLLYAGFGLLAIAALVPMAALLRLIGMLAVAPWSRVPLRPRLADVRWASLREIRGFVSLIFAQDTARRWFFQLDSFLAARLLPLPDLAILAVARRFSLAVVLFGTQTLNVAYPIISAAAARHDRSLLEKFLLVATRNLFAALLPVATVLFIWAEPVLRLWIGPEALSGVGVFQVLVIFAVFSSLVEIPLTLLYGLGKIGLNAVLFIVMLLAGIALGPWASSSGGLWGLSLMYTSIQTVGTVLLLARAVKLSEVPVGRLWEKALSPVLLAELPALAWCWISYRLVPHTWIGLAVSAIGSLLLFTGVFLRLAAGPEKQTWQTRARRLLREVG